MLKEKEQVVREATIILDAAVVAAAFVLAFLLRKHLHLFYDLDIFPGKTLTSSIDGSLSDYFVVLFLGVFIWCTALHVNGMYHSMRLRSLAEIIWTVIKSTFFASITLSAMIFVLKYKFVSRFIFAGFIFGGSFLLALEKTALFFIARYVRKQGYNYRRLLVVGTGRRAMHFIERVRSHPEWGLKIFGIIDDEERNEQETADEDIIGKPGHFSAMVKQLSIVIGKLGDLSAIVKRLSIDEVIFLVPRSRLAHIEPAIYDCETLGVKATIALDLFELKIAKARQSELDGIPFITFDTTSLKERPLFIKRVIDLVGSTLGIVILSPILLVISILIKATSKGPVFYLSKRIGLNGRKFVMFKFRTMYKGAHRKQKELSGKNLMQGPVFKVKDDPRVTPVGRFLRKLSLDELPQLFNVFFGHMSIVGPRPPVQKEVLKYESWQRRRLSMRPGITCLWQAGGRNKIDFDEWMRLDLHYLDNWSLWMDFKILLKTIPVVLSGKGAY